MAVEEPLVSMGWAKVAEVLLASDSTEISIPLSIQNNRMYLILGEGKASGSSSSEISFGSELTSFCSLTSLVDFFEETYYVLGLLIGQGNDWLSHLLSHQLRIYSRKIERSSFDSGETLMEPPLQFPLADTVFIRITDGTLKAGYKLAIFEKPIE